MHDIYEHQMTHSFCYETCGLRHAIYKSTIVLQSNNYTNEVE